MEKVLYLAQLPDSTSAEHFRNHDMHSVADSLMSDITGVARLSMLLDDDTVKPAAQWRIKSNDAMPEAVVSICLDSANHHPKIQRILGRYLVGIRGFLVSESEALINPARGKGRSEGSVQLCTFSKKSEISQSELIQRWRGDHTAIAIDNQSSLAYRQNLVICELDSDTTGIDAIVEEQFPVKAMNSIEALFDAEQNPEELKKRRTIMQKSCERFIDFSTINVVHLSEFIFK